MEDKYINELIKLSVKSLKKSEIAVSAIIVKNDKIIASAYNQRRKKKDVTAHAEIIAIKKAEKKIRDWRLNGCDMYVTLKPCRMCEEIIKASRLDNCFYLIDKPDDNKEYDKTKVSYMQTNKTEKLKKIFHKSFQKLR